jgi:hypothetical protein
LSGFTNAATGDSKGNCCKHLSQSLRKANDMSIVCCVHAYHKSSAINARQTGRPISCQEANVCGFCKLLPSKPLELTCFIVHGTLSESPSPIVREPEPKLLTISIHVLVECTNSKGNDSQALSSVSANATWCQINPPDEALGRDVALPDEVRQRPLPRLLKVIQRFACMPHPRTAHKDKVLYMLRVLGRTRIPREVSASGFTCQTPGIRLTLALDSRVPVFGSHDFAPKCSLP